MKKIKTPLLILAFIAILLAVKFYYFPLPKEESAPAGGKPTGAKPFTLVSTYLAKTENLDNNLFATGTILANETVELKPEIAGKITNLYLKEGEAVRKGQLLVKLNDADLQALMAKNTAQTKLAREKWERYAALLKIQGVSQEEHDIALNQLQILQADADLINVQIEKTKITAPFNGILGLRNISEGSYITPQQSIATIQQLNPIKVDFSVPERYANLVKKGTKINFSVEGNPKKFQGLVYALEPSIDETTRMLKIRAKADVSGSSITPGAFAKIELLLNKNERAIMIPTQAIVPILKGQQVYVCRNGKAETVLVETGLRNDLMVQILSGIQVGDSVVVAGVMSVRPGSLLKMMN